MAESEKYFEIVCEVIRTGLESERRFLKYI
jgi:hypothetical protein